MAITIDQLSKKIINRMGTSSQQKKLFKQRSSRILERKLKIVESGTIVPL